MTEATTEPAAEPGAEPAVEGAPEPARRPAAEGGPEPAAAPAREPARRPAPEAAAEGVRAGRLRIALLVGSVRRPRLADPLAAWLERELTATGWLDLDTIDLAAVPLPMHAVQPGGTPASPIAGRLAAADAFVLLTPEHNHSFPASVKNAIDWHVAEWAYKPVAFVGYGGSGGIRAVEQLRAVFPELRAITIREAVLLPRAWEHLDADGTFVPPPGTVQALHATTTELRKWARALRPLRTPTPTGRP